MDQIVGGGRGLGTMRTASKTGVATLTVIAMDYLEVLHRSLCDAPVEIKYIGLCVIIPDWRLVLQLNDALRVLVLPAC